MTGQTLRNQVVLIAGAGRRPGPALALAFAQAGAVVAANDLSPVLLDPLREAAQGLPGKIQTYVADATRGMPLRAMLDEIYDDWGRIDVLVNNPRIMPDVLLLEMDEWDWHRTVEMNLNGPFLLTKLIARQMQELGQGVILNLVDMGPESLSAPGKSAYAASQAGFLSFSQSAARELIAYNIRVHTLCPDAEVLHLFHPDDTSATAAVVSPHPGDALARLVVYLSGPGAAHLAGQTFQVNRDTFTPQPGTDPLEQG